MIPEEIEARFERIEAILALTVEQNSMREQQMQLMSISINHLLEASVEDKQWKTDIEAQNADRNEQMQLMSIGINRLLESSTEYRRWKVETDQRFNILLEEVRSVNRRVNGLENP